MPINKRFCFAGLTLAVALGALTVVPFGRGAAAVQDRIPDGIDNTHRVALHGQVHRLARPEFDQGSLPGSTLLEHMTLVFARSAAQQQALDALLQAQQDRTSPQYHQWLSPEQFGERFGMSDSDLAKVKTWLQQQGFTVTEVARSRDSVTFRGTVAQVNAAFATSIDRYKVNGETHFANASEPLLPSALAQVTLTLRGLHDFRPRPQVVRPKYTSYISGNHFITPDDFATIYDLKPLYNMTPSAIDGTGQTIAVMGQTDILLNDLSTFRQNSGLPPNAPQACSGCNNSTFAIPGPDPGVQQGDLTEADLDLEWAGAVAPKANIIYVNAGTQGGAFDALQYAVNNNVAPVISVSYGTCETQDIGPATTGGTVAWLDNLAQKANAQGITIVGPAGDSGAADCDAGVANPSGSPNQNTIPATQGLSIDVPGASPSVTSVGGTQFNASSNNSSFWNAGNNSLNGSALGYIPEVAWNETQSQGGFSESGGGFSTVFAKPAYQQSFTSAGGIGMPGGNARYAPDIAMLAGAGPNEGGLLTCTNGSCANGFRDSNQNLSPVGGTSAGVPTFAAMVVLLNQMSGAHFDSVHNTWVNSQGNINPALYSLATRTSDQAFHDITSGNNQVPCTPGSPNSKNTALNCPPSGTFGYSAGVGYDQVTGLGSVDAFKVVYELANNANSAPAPAGDFSINGQPSTLPVTRGGSAANFQATFNVSGSFTSPINVSCFVGGGGDAQNVTGMTCTPSASVATPGVPMTFTVSAASQVSSLRPQPPLHAPWSLAWTGISAVVFCGGTAAAARKRRNRKTAAIVMSMLTLAALGILVSCGGGGSSSANNNTSTSTSTSTSPAVASVTVSPSGVIGTATTTGTVTLASAAPSSGTTVTLSSSSPLATVPSGVTVAAGATTATFTVSTKAVTTPSAVTISASSGGGSQSATLNIASVAVVVQGWVGSASGPTYGSVIHSVVVPVSLQ